MRTTDAILLAAGRSARMGQPKQFLDIDGKPMIIHAINTIQKCSAIRQLVVVLGYQAILLQNLISKNKVLIAENSNWTEGMGSSLRIGLRKILEIIPPADNLLITVCDQPLLNSNLLDALIQEQLPGHITASNYGANIGTPAVFDRIYLPELLSVPDQVGARKLFEKHPEKIRTIPFPGGELDLDTWEDYQNYISNKSPGSKENKPEKPI